MEKNLNQNQTPEQNGIVADLPELGAPPAQENQPPTTNGAPPQAPETAPPPPPQKPPAQGAQPSTPPEPTEEELLAREKEFYGEKRYKRIEKLRAKGKSLGMSIPYLEHPLIKTKPSIACIILAIFSGILTLGIIGGIGYVLFGLGFYKDIFGAFGTALGFSSHHSWDFLGIAQFGGFLGTLFTILILLTVIAMMVGIVWFFVWLTRKLISMVNLSVQERAQSTSVKKMLITLGAIILIPIITILVMKNQKVSPGSIQPKETDWTLLIIVWAVAAVIVGAILLLAFLERIQAKKLYAKIPKDQLANFNKHNNALIRVKKAKSKTRQKLRRLFKR